MITAASNPAWPEDVMIVDYEPTGLPVPSRIRTGKIATVAVTSATPVGRLPGPIWNDVRGRMALR